MEIKTITEKIKKLHDSPLYYQDKDFKLKVDILIDRHLDSLIEINDVLSELFDLIAVLQDENDG